MMKPTTMTKMNTMMMTMMIMMSMTMKMMVRRICLSKSALRFKNSNFHSEYDDEIAERVIGVDDDDDDYEDDDDDDYDLDDDVYDTEGLFDDGNEGKQDNEGLLHSNTLDENYFDEKETEVHNTSEL